MKKTITILTVIMTIITITSIIIPQVVRADYDGGEIKRKVENAIKDKNEIDAVENEFEDVIKSITNLGSIISVIALLLLGIKYMVSSIDEKAEYKQRMGIYLLGAIFVFAISRILAIIQEIGGTIIQSGSVEQAGQRVVTIISVIGSIISVVILIMLGIKYMGGSLEEKSQYKNAMLPYLIGAILVFAASQIAGIVYQFAKGL